MCVSISKKVVICILIIPIDCFIVWTVLLSENKLLKWKCNKMIYLRWACSVELSATLTCWNCLAGSHSSWNSCWLRLPIWVCFQSCNGSRDLGYGGRPASSFRYFHCCCLRRDCCFKNCHRPTYPTKVRHSMTMARWRCSSPRITAGQSFVGSKYWT